jgi:excisionase family DNA binding protein
MNRLIDGYLTVQQAADELGLTTNQVYILVRSKRLRHHRLGARGGLLRFRREDLLAYLASTAVEPAAPRKARDGTTKLKHIKG